MPNNFVLNHTTIIIIVVLLSSLYSLGVRAQNDFDFDTIPDNIDNCPSIGNLDQADHDGDGVGNACDFTDTLDTDFDGTPDTVDVCPDTMDWLQVDSDGDGTGDACDLDSPLSASSPFAPIGSGYATSPVFVWQGIAQASWYRLWIEDAARNILVDQWYTTDSVYCDTGSRCVADPNITHTGAIRWWIQTWSLKGYGPWSSPRTAVLANGLPEAPVISIPLADPVFGLRLAWEPIPNATWYQVWINDTTGNSVSHWYTSYYNACASALITCVAFGEQPLALPATAWVRGWNSEGVGPWSVPEILDLPD